MVLVKRAVSVFVSVFLALGLMPLSAFAAVGNSLILSDGAHADGELTVPFAASVQSAGADGVASGEGDASDESVAGSSVSDDALVGGGTLETQATLRDDEHGAWGTCQWDIVNGELTIHAGTGEDTTVENGHTAKCPWSIEEGRDRGITKVVVEAGVIFPADCSSLFAYYYHDSDYNIFSDIKEMTFGAIDTSQVTNMARMFYGCGAERLDLSGFNTTNVTSMSGMFSDAMGIKYLDISSFDTSKLAPGTTGLPNYNSSFMLPSKQNGLYWHQPAIESVKIGPNVGGTYLSTLYCPTGYKWANADKSLAYTASELAANWNGAAMAGTWNLADYRAQISLIDITGVNTSLDPSSTVTFSGKLNPSVAGLSDQLELTDETWTSADGASVISKAKPAKPAEGKTYWYKATVKIKDPSKYKFAVIDGVNAPITVVLNGARSTVQQMGIGSSSSVVDNGTPTAWFVANPSSAYPNMRYLTGITPNVVAKAAGGSQAVSNGGGDSSGADSVDQGGGPSDAQAAGGSSVQQSAVGASVKSSGSTLKVTSDGTGAKATASFTKASKSKKSVKIPATVKVNGKTYQVTGIAKNAFKDSKAKTVTVKSKKLTKKSVKGCFKGSKVKTVKVPKSKLKAYKKIFSKKNCGKKVKVVAA